MKRFTIIEAPSIFGLTPSGVQGSPEALLAAGLASRLRARHGGRVEPRTPYSGDIDPETRMLNPHGIAQYSRELANAVGRVLD
ncbi:MAG TPA: hypothetical protein VE420_04700, partial [Gemmatimonadales bacterium]|nr:hypothetical protein [Gemmatimonadales bacterium]